MAEKPTFPSEDPAPLGILWEMGTSPPGIKPRMYSVDFENRPGDLGVTAIVFADAPEAALEKAFNLFP